jgi:hypothetical protein
MPRGPKGEKRPADVIGAAVMVARIATGEIEDTKGKAPNRAALCGELRNRDTSALPLFRRDVLDACTVCRNVIGAVGQVHTLG